MRAIRAESIPTFTATTSSSFLYRRFHVTIVGRKGSPRVSVLAERSSFPTPHSTQSISCRMISSYSACATAHGPLIRSEARIHYDSLAQRRPIVHFSSISIKQASGRAGGCVPCYRRNCEDVMNVVNMWPPAAPHPLPHRRLDTLCCAFFGPRPCSSLAGTGFALPIERIC